MISEGKIWIAQGDEKVYLVPKMANRHGLIAGASGTGKTVTLRSLAESFSDLGVPVFLSDIKGDLGGLCRPGKEKSWISDNVKKFGIEDFDYAGFPTCFWDIYGKKGIPVRTTIGSMGSILLARLMGLTDIQSDVLMIVFRICEDRKWDLVDINDLRTAIQYVADNRADLTSKYGNISPQTIGAVQRSLLVLEDLGGDMFFGEPSLDIKDWMKIDDGGRGMINILHSVELARNPTLYATFLVWMMDSLFEILPEAGDLDKPKLVFFFDEAHMLFTDAPKMLVQKVEQVVKLIRSKGVGIYFITQSPSDIPDSVLAQLSNRIQHALRAYTPSEQKAVRAAASSFRENPKFETADVITELGIGEVLISCLDDGGRPCVVQKAMVLPPRSMLSVLSDTDYRKEINSSDLEGKYGEREERRSAAEDIGSQKKIEISTASDKKTPAKREAAPKKASSSKKKSTASNAVGKAVGSAATSIGREAGKAIFKSLFGKK